jgi:hypothetical protein
MLLVSDVLYADILGCPRCSMASGRWLWLDVLAVERFGLIVCAAHSSHCSAAALLASTLVVPVAPTTGSVGSSTDAYPAQHSVGVSRGRAHPTGTPQSGTSIITVIKFASDSSVKAAQTASSAPLCV